MSDYNEKNEIRMFGELTRQQNEEVTDNNKDKGVAYKDSTWKDENARKNGVIKGVAHSIDYNTALRQASMMSTVLADIVANRYDRYVSTDLDYIKENEGSVYTNFMNYITSLSNLFNKDKFLLNSEVKKKHLNDDITTAYFENMSVGNATNATYVSYSDGDTTKKTIEQRLTDLGFNYGTISEDITLPTGTNSATENKIIKSGNLVYIHFKFVPESLEVTMDDINLTIPEKYRPSTNKKIPMCTIHSGVDILDTAYNTKVHISTDGTIKFINDDDNEISSTTKCNSLEFSIAYSTVSTNLNDLDSNSEE